MKTNWHKVRLRCPGFSTQAAIRIQSLVGLLVGIVLTAGTCFLLWTVARQFYGATETEAAHAPSRHEAGIVLGEDPVESGLQLLNMGDGQVTVTNMDGASCVQLRNRFESYLYFAVDPGLKTSQHINAIIHIEFLSLMSGRFDVQFDGYKFGERPGSVYSDTPVGVRFDRWPHWHQVAMEISNARFSGRQNNGADFRLRVNCPLFYVRSVKLTEIENAAETPEASPQPDIGRVRER